MTPKISRGMSKQKLPVKGGSNVSEKTERSDLPATASLVGSISSDNFTGTNKTDDDMDTPWQGNDQDDDANDEDDGGNGTSKKLEMDKVMILMLCYVVMADCFVGTFCVSQWWFWFCRGARLVRQGSMSIS